jgi:hypothetical protein
MIFIMRVDCVRCRGKKVSKVSKDGNSCKCTKCGYETNRLDIWRRTTEYIKIVKEQLHEELELKPQERKNRNGIITGRKR